MSKIDKTVAKIWPECDSPSKVNDKIKALKLGNNALARMLGVNKSSISRRLAEIKGGK